MEFQDKKSTEKVISAPGRKEEWSAPQIIELSRGDTAGKPFTTKEDGIGGLS